MLVLGCRTDGLILLLQIEAKRIGGNGRDGGHAASSLAVWMASRLHEEDFPAGQPNQARNAPIRISEAVTESQPLSRAS